MIKTENKYWVENDVYDSAQKSGDHRKARAAVRANYRVHRLTEHIERNAQRDVKKVFLRVSKRLVVYSTAEHG